MAQAASQDGNRWRGRSFFVLDTHQLTAAILFILLFAMAVRIPTDTDTWWHLRTGDHILANRDVPLTDPFSHTRLGEPWIDHSWGSQVVMTLFYRLLGGEQGGGNVALALYTAILASVGMGFVFLMCEGDVFVRAFTIVIGAAAAAVFWSARPQMFSFALSAGLLYLLHLYKRRGRDSLWLIPLLMVIWVNLHGGFSIGFILLIGFIGGESIGRVLDRKNPDLLSWKQIRRLLMFTLVGAAVLVLNPNTTQMWSYPFRTFGIGALQDFIQEWASPNFHGRETWGFVLLLLGTFGAVGLSGKKIGWSDLALVSGTTFMSLYAGRNISTFALVATPVFSRHFASWLESLGWRIRRPRRPRGGMAILNGALLLVVLGGGLLKIAATLQPRIVESAQKEYLPVEVAAFLNQANLSGKMFNSYNWGGYLMFAAPDYPVFVDGRTDLYDDALLRQWLATTGGKDWEATFAQFGIDLVVIERDSSLAGILRQNPGWREVYSDSMASVFERTESAP